MKDIRPTLGRGCRLMEKDGQPATIVIPEGLIHLNAVGFRIVQLCDGQRNLGEIVDNVRKSFSPDDHARIERETIEFLERLRERRAVDFT